MRTSLLKFIFGLQRVNLCKRGQALSSAHPSLPLSPSLSLSLSLTDLAGIDASLLLVVEAVYNGLCLW